MSVPGQGEVGPDPPPPPAPPAAPPTDPLVPLPTPTPLEPTPATDDLALTLQSLADRVDALEKTGGFAPGMIVWTASDDAPPGWLIADGSAFDVNLYAALAIACPTGFLPNLVDRFVVGAGTTYPLLSAGGAAAITLTAAQSGMPAHMHTIAAATGSTTPAGVTSGSTTPAGVTSGSTTPGATGSTTPGATGATGGTTGVDSPDHAHVTDVGMVARGSTLAGSGGLSVFFDTVGGENRGSGGATARHAHSMPSHTHTSAAHTHTSAAHTHTVGGSAHTHTVAGSAHTHALPDTDTAAGVSASSAISTLSPYVALTPLIHI